MTLFQFPELGDGGDVTVADFYRTAKDICATPNTDQPFMCLDVSYMAVLLEDGYGLKPQTKIKVFAAAHIVLLINFYSKLTFFLFITFRSFSYARKFKVMKFLGL